MEDRNEGRLSRKIKRKKVRKIGNKIKSKEGGDRKQGGKIGSKRKMGSNDGRKVGRNDRRKEA